MRIYQTPLRDRLADYIAENDCSVKAASRALGVEYSNAKVAWRRIRRALGSQAS